jgi:LysW-gamma-L-lysine carboxypeptidase
MLEAYSPSGSETKLANLLYEQMASQGFKVRFDPAGNVLGEIGEDGPRILLCGHMDTVSGEIPVHREGDQLYGRGAVDAKSALAAMIAGTLIARKRSQLPFRVTVAAVVEEETSSKGVKAIIEDCTHLDLAVFGEPSGASSVITGYKGSLKLQVTCETSGGHSASPWLSQNSYEETYSFWKAFETSILQNDSESKFSNVTGCVTGARAGDSGNSVPSHAVLDIDVRIPPNMKSIDLLNTARKFAAEYQRNHLGVSIDFQAKDRTEAYLANESTLGISAFRWAIRQAGLGQMSFVRKTGTSDMNVFAENRNTSMFAYGPGDSRLDHTATEHVSIVEYLKSIEVYGLALPRLAELINSRVLSPTAK